MKYEKVFTNTLYYTKQTNKNQSKFVQAFDCRIDKDDLTMSKTTDSDLNEVNNKPIKNTQPCIINFLNLKQEKLQILLIAIETIFLYFLSF
jgi:hypothetical protein